MTTEELHQVVEIRHANVHTTTRINLIQQLLWRHLSPAPKHFKAHPVQVKVLVTHRVVDQPTRAATRPGAPLDQFQLLPQLREHAFGFHHSSK